MTCDVRRRYAITLAELLHTDVTVHKLFRYIRRIGASRLSMLVDLGPSLKFGQRLMLPVNFRKLF